MVRYCSVYGCLENSKTNKLRRFFRFPSDDVRCKHWIKAIGRMDLVNKGVHTLNTSYFVCELHFPGSDCRKKYLRGDAIPTLLLPQLEDKTGTTKYTQTDGNITGCVCDMSNTSHLSPTADFWSENTLRKRKLRFELLESERKRRRRSI